MIPRQQRQLCTLLKFWKFITKCPIYLFRKTCIGFIFSLSSQIGSRSAFIFRKPILNWILWRLLVSVRSVVDWHSVRVATSCLVDEYIIHSIYIHMIIAPLNNRRLQLPQTTYPFLCGWLWNALNLLLNAHWSPFVVIFWVMSLCQKFFY